MIVMYITDARDQHIRNVLTTSAMPMGSHNRYRYDRRWIDSQLWQRWDRDGLVGDRVLVSYLEGNTGNLENARAFPVRYGRVIRSEVKGSFGVLDVALEDFTKAVIPPELRADSEAGVMSIDQPRNGRFVVEHEVGDPEEARDVAAWQATVSALGRMDTYRDSSFIFVEQLGRAADGKPIAVNSESHFDLQPKSLIELSLHVLMPRDRAPLHTYSVLTDTSLLRSAQPAQLHFGHRFSTERLLLQTPDKAQRALTYIYILPEPGTRGPEVRLLVDLREPASRRALAFGVPGSAAAVAASAGVLPAETPLWLRFVMVAAGSAGLAAASARR
ncbi:hypothetical protein [Kribbella sp. DT2]|uniref:hypothetical protein n=1 Tax=Kribbella sp. DT2 TaxID=3393427 RepID=UPI003CFA0EF7